MSAFLVETQAVAAEAASVAEDTAAAAATETEDTAAVAAAQ